MRKAFVEKHADYQFKGKMILYLGVPTSSSLLYRADDPWDRSIAQKRSETYS